MIVQLRATGFTSQAGTNKEIKKIQIEIRSSKFSWFFLVNLARHFSINLLVPDSSQYIAYLKEVWTKYSFGLTYTVPQFRLDFLHDISVVFYQYLEIFVFMNLVQRGIKHTKEIIRITVQKSIGKDVIFHHLQGVRLLSVQILKAYLYATRMKKLSIPKFWCQIFVKSRRTLWVLVLANADFQHYDGR